MLQVRVMDRTRGRKSGDGGMLRDAQGWGDALEQDAWDRADARGERCLGWGSAFEGDVGGQRGCLGWQCSGWGLP